ncbi:MAG: hypothetical protein U1E65_14105 [Myxococcota bacterium]
MKETALRWSLATTLLASCGGGTTPMTEQCLNVSGTVNAATGVEIKKPTKEPSGCHIVPNPNTANMQVKNICQQKAPDLSCVGQPKARGTSYNVTFRGCVKTFGLGATSFGLTVALFREKLPDGTRVDPGYDVTGAPGAQTNNTPAAFIGTMVSTQVDTTVCPDGGHFEIPNVPTETDLISRVTHQNVDKTHRDYVDAYQYNVVLENTAITDANGMPVADPATTCQTAGACVVTDDVNTIQNGTYQTISRAAGVSVVTGQDDLYDGSGQGHIAGEVQDCTSLDKVQNAAVAIDATARKLSYFNVGFTEDEGNIDDPKPNSTRAMTNADGLYLALAVDTMTGGKEVTVGAAVTPTVCGPDNVCICNPDGTKNTAWSVADAGEGQQKILGTRRIYVFPDSVTILTFDRGLYEHP